MDLMLHEDLDIGKGQVITSQRILWDVIIYSCPRNLPVAHVSYELCVILASPVSSVVIYTTGISLAKSLVIHGNRKYLVQWMSLLRIQVYCSITCDRCYISYTSSHIMIPSARRKTHTGDKCFPGQDIKHTNFLTRLCIFKETEI